MDQQPQQHKNQTMNGPGQGKKFISDMENKLNLGGLEKTIEEKVDMIRDSASVAMEKAEDVVKKHPYRAVLGAAAVGALVGFLAHKKITKH